MDFFPETIFEDAPKALIMSLLEKYPGSAIYYQYHFNISEETGSIQNHGIGVLIS